MVDEQHELVATFQDPAAARAAIASLERHGLDAERIRMSAPGVRASCTGDHQREVDHDSTKHIARRGFATSALVAVTAAVVAGVAAWFVSGGQAMPTIGSAVGFFMAGGAIGFFYGGASALTVSEEFNETYEATGAAMLMVRVTEDEVANVREQLTAANADTLQLDGH